MNPLIHKVGIAAIAMFAVTAPKSDIKFEVRNYESGGISGFEQPYQAVVSDEKTWKKLWEVHKGVSVLNGIVNADGGIPKIDFEKSNVLALFMGQMAGVEGFALANVDVKDPKKVVVRLVPQSLPVNSTVINNPYVMLETTKSELPVEFQMAVGKGQWKTIGTLTPPKKDKSKETSSR